MLSVLSLCASSYNFSCLQGSAELYVRVTDYDPHNSNDRVDDIYAPISISPAQSTTTRTFVGQYGNGRLGLSFHLACLGDFYGARCSTFCRPIDDVDDGHFACGPNGERVCLPGWQDPGNHCLTRNKLHASQALCTSKHYCVSFSHAAVCTVLECNPIGGDCTDPHVCT